jgi:preprotein translocase subunit YajC
MTNDETTLTLIPLVVIALVARIFLTKREEKKREKDHD